MSNNQIVQPTVQDDSQNLATPQSLGSGNFAVDDGYLSTVQIDPNKLSQSQVQSDLEAIKRAEFGSADPTSPSEKEEQPLSTEEVQAKKPQELAALELKNPFKGE